jgi:hypothetical protein
LAPITVHNKDVTGLVMAPFASFDLRGGVDFSNLITRGINVYSAEVVVDFQDGSFSNSQPVNPAGGSWSLLSLTGEASSPVRIVLETYTDKGTFFDEIQTKLSEQSNLDFKPEPVSAGALITGKGLGRGTYYNYLFEPTIGSYVFTVKSPGTHLELYDVTTNARVSPSSSQDFYYDSLSVGSAYYIQVNLNNSFSQDFAFQVDPVKTTVTKVTLGGTVDFSDIPSGVSVTSAKIDIFADYNLLGSEPITLSAGTGSWSSSVDYYGSPRPVVFVITADLDTPVTITHQEAGSISGSDTNLSFKPEIVITGEKEVTRTPITGSDTFLYVPDADGYYSLGVDADPNNNWGAARTSLELRDLQTGGSYYADDPDNDGKVELMAYLDAGTPYIIEVYSPTGTYGFQAKAEEQLTLGGTVGYSGLSPWTTNSEEILIFFLDDLSPYPISESVQSDGTWSISGPVSSLPKTDEAVIALVASSSGGEWVLETQTVGLSGDNKTINFSPDASDKSVATGAWHTRSTVGGTDWLLWVPPSSGFYQLDAESIDPYMYLYEDSGLGWQLVAENDDYRDGYNSRIDYNFTGGRPYLIRVKDLNGSGDFRFKADLP